MGSVVNNRLEGFTRGTDLLPGLEARVHDALWLLARQWQLGELEGSDGGTPISATYALSHTPIARWQAGTGALAPYSGDRPLEALVEEDGTGPSWRDRVAAGLRLARALRRAGLEPGRLVALHPLGIPDAAADPDADPATHDTSAVTPVEVQTVASVTAGRVADPDAVAAAYDASVDDLVTAVGGEAARSVLTDWRTWWGSRQARDAGGWDPTTLTYSMSVAVSEPVAPVYKADRFGGGSVDWYDFDVVAPPSAPAAGTPQPVAGTAQPVAGSPPAGPATSTTQQSTAIPVPVTFHGAPVARYWQMDDARTDFGAIDTFPTEIGKLLLAEFTACFAGDWYRLPVRIPYGCAVHVDALVSTDTFGAATLVPAAAAAGGPRPWRMFEHTASAGADGLWLLVPPVLASGTDAAPSEEIVLMRDPTADLAWAVEQIVTNAVGRAVRRSEDLRAQGREPPPDPRAPLPNTWVWRLATSVPENWIPLLPTRGRAETDDYELVQGAMIRYRRAPDGTLSAVPIIPAGLLLRTGLRLPEREVPREGLAVHRFRRVARWVDGTQARWWSRTTDIGQGEGSSGLAYDGLHPDTGPLALGQ